MRFTQPEDCYEEPISKDRNRIETRKVSVYRDLSMLTDTEWKQLLVCLIVVERLRREFNTKTREWEGKTETSFYVCSQLFSAKTICKIIRDHWQIENCDHYVRDVSFLEDGCKIRLKPDNIAILRSFALNVMRFNKEKEIKSTLYENSLDFNGLYRYQQLM